MGVHDTQHYPLIKERLGIPHDEPIFILRAQDLYSVDTLESYAEHVEGMASVEFHEGIGKCRTEFVEWQVAHPDRVKTPD